jgi:hypothetical protein
MQRYDKLVERAHDYTTGWVVEKFDHGRSRFLKGSEPTISLP